MTVRELLSRMDSKELSEWQAYEAVVGPLDEQWRDETLAQIRDLLDYGNYMFGSQGRPNPWPEPKGYARPWQLLEETRRKQQGQQ